MKQAVILLVVVASAFSLANAAFGYRAAYQIGYGAFALMAAMISLTFLWLWIRRATSLALGMSFSWAGASSVIGWWWVYNVLNRPETMFEQELLFFFLSRYFVGAILHFTVMQRSFGFQSGIFIVPVGLSLAISGTVHLIF